jgi:hypothetical protein
VAAARASAAALAAVALGAILTSLVRPPAC